MPLTTTSPSDVTDRRMRHMVAVREHWESVAMIKDGLKEIYGGRDLISAAEAWFELTNDEKQDLWLAPRDGGIFTTEEREIIKSTEFRVSYYGP